MARSVYSKPQVISDDCCTGGIHWETCRDCGGHSPRNTDKCPTCRGTGVTGTRCPNHAAYKSTGSYPAPSNPPAYGGNAGYGGSAGYGQQGYGSTSGH